MRTSGSRYLAIIGLACIACSGVRAQAEPCTVDAARAGGDAGLFAVAGEADPSAVSIECQGSALAGLTARLSAGERTSARIFWRQGEAGTVRLVAGPEAGPNWLAQTSQLVDGSGRWITLEWSAPDSARPGTRRTVRLSAGEWSIGVSLEVIDGGALFQDGFDVDPVIGQFSMVR